MNWPGVSETVAVLAPQQYEVFYVTDGATLKRGRAVRFASVRGFGTEENRLDKISKETEKLSKFGEEKC